MLVLHIIFLFDSSITVVMIVYMYEVKYHEGCCQENFY